jgi:hypothetical protein
MKLTKMLAFAGLTLLLAHIGCAQGVSRVVPESGFVSSEMYVNAFFGFSLPLPRDGYHIAHISSNIRREQNLFGLAQERGATLFSVSAQQTDTKLASKLMGVNPIISVDGQQFSKGVSQQKKDGNTEWTAMYLTALDGYLLQFEIHSRDRGIAEDLQRCVEEIKFFNPSKAKEVAGPNSREYNPALPGQSKHSPKD